MPSTSSLALGPVILLVSLLLGSTPAFASEAELDDLQLIVDGVNRASSEQKMPLLSAVFAAGARDHGWDAGTCPDAWEAMGKRISVKEKERAVLLAYPGCPAMCARSHVAATARAVVGAEPLQRTAVLVEACDAEGPEPVFSGDRMWMRDQMSYWDYWVYRSMFDMAFQRLDAIGGERAAATRVGFEDLLGLVSYNLARHLPPSIEGLQLPPTTATVPPWKGLYSHVWITTDAVLLDGVTVCALDGGRVPPGDVAEGTISPLLTALGAAYEANAAAHEREFGRRVPFSARLLILPDRGVDAEVLVQVIQTAVAAKIWETQVAGYNAELERLTRLRLEQPVKRPPGVDPGPELTVELSNEEMTVRGRSQTLDGGVRFKSSAEGPDVEALAELCARLKEEWPDEVFVVLEVAADVQYGDLMKVLVATRGAPLDSWVEGELFPYAMIRTAPAEP